MVDHHGRICAGDRGGGWGGRPGPGNRFGRGGHRAQPGAVGEIRGVLILGLVLIESLVIYVLLVTLILFFIKPFGG